MLFVEALEGVEEIELVARELADVPLLFNWVEGGRTPPLPYERLAELGYALVIFPIGALLAATSAVQRYLAAVRRAGSPLPVLDELPGFDSFLDVIGLAEIGDLERRFADGAEAPAPAPRSAHPGVERPVADHRRRGQVGQLLVGETEHPAEDLPVVLAEQRRVAAQHGAGLREAPRRGELLVAAHEGMRQVHPEVAGQEVWVVEHGAGVEHPTGGDAGALQRLHGRLGVALPAPRIEHGIELVVAGAALRERESGQLVTSHEARQRRPLAVGPAGDHQPLLVAACAPLGRRRRGPIAPLGDEAGGAVAVVDRLLAPQRGGHERFAGHHRAGLALRHVDHAAPRRCAGAG